MRCEVFKVLEGELVRGSSGAAGWDLRCLNAFTLYPGEVKCVDTGVKVEIEPGWFGSLRGRSGLALRGIDVLGGVIDSDYRGEVKVVMVNLGTEAVEFKAGNRIAQMVVEVCYMGGEVGGERGECGFGSTGA